MAKELTKEIKLAHNLGAEKVELTKEGKKELEIKLLDLINKHRPIIAAELKEARAQGDLSENADYDAAKNKQAELEAEISRIEDVLSRVEIIQERKTKAVRVGSKIEYVRDGKTLKAQIVGPVEADPNDDIPKIGSDTPFAKAIMGLEEGQEAKVHTIKPFSVKIKKIL